MEVYDIKVKDTEEINDSEIKYTLGYNIKSDKSAKTIDKDYSKQLPTIDFHLVIVEDNWKIKSTSGFTK